MNYDKPAIEAITIPRPVADLVIANHLHVAIYKKPHWWWRMWQWLILGFRYEAYK